MCHPGIGAPIARGVVDVCLASPAPCLRGRCACLFNAYQTRLAVEFKKELFGFAPSSSAMSAMFALPCRRMTRV
jgi:hypothetical protein